MNPESQTQTSHKNRLQEYCQSERIGFPLYDSYKTQSGFRCIAQLTTKDNTVLKGEGEGTKIKSAEKRAALNILSQLHKKHKSEIKIISRSTASEKYSYTVTYLDIENINVNQLEELFKTHKYDPTQFLFIGCLSTNHHYAQKQFDYEGIAFEKVLVPSSRSDAADIGMIMHALRNHIHPLNHKPASEIIFVSRDKFSCVFIELLNKNFCIDTEDIKALHCSCVNDMKELL